MKGDVFYQLESKYHHMLNVGRLDEFGKIIEDVSVKYPEYNKKIFIDVCLNKYGYTVDDYLDFIRDDHNNACIVLSNRSIKNSVFENIYNKALNDIDGYSLIQRCNGIYIIISNRKE